jgi:hypothetical protein
MNKKAPEFVNLLDMKPKRLYPFEVEEGRVVVLVPKFSGRFGQWFLLKLRKPNIRVKLDTLGSFVWNHCQGVITVREIADRLKGEFGESAEPVYERVGEFIKRLHRDRLIEMGLIQD